MPQSQPNVYINHIGFLCKSEKKVVVNNCNATFVSGVGYNNPMPHSRFLGTCPGGFMAGYIGDSKDQPQADFERKAQWNTTEYWNTPLANCCMALALLLPKEIALDAKLGMKYLSQ